MLQVQRALAFFVLLAIQLTTASKHDNHSQLYAVTIEEHWVAPALLNYTLSNRILQLLIQGTFGSQLGPLIRDINTTRLENMNNNSIRMQVVSHNPSPLSLSQPEAVALANNQLAERIAPYPNRFRGFCFLPMAFPSLAAAELSRCIRDLGFVGALIDNNLPNGTFYDGAAYDVFWAMAEKLSVPIYIHPTFPADAAVFAAGGRDAPTPNVEEDFDLFYASNLATTAWDFHSTVGLHFMRLYSAGMFERHPGLKVVLGHFGEMVPYMLERSDDFLSQQNRTMKSLKQVYKDNIWITTAGFFWTEQVPTVLRNTDISRILYSVDYPFASNERGTTFLKELKRSGYVTPEQFEQISHGNAEKLLGLPTGQT